MTDRASLRVSDYIGADRVTVEYTYAGDLDAAIAHLVERAQTIRAKPGHHFDGLSIGWDREHSQTYLCRVSYDREEVTE